MGARIALIAVVAAACGAAVWFGTSRASGAEPAGVVLHVGDTVRIAGTDLGCAVARRGGATTVECLPARRSAGTYATLTGSTTVRVVRFRTTTVAQTVFHAKQHDPHPVTCR
jgi:hypothetical protein